MHANDDTRRGIFYATIRAVHAATIRAAFYAIHGAVYLPIHRATLCVTTNAVRGRAARLKEKLNVC